MSIRNHFLFLCALITAVACKDQHKQTAQHTNIQSKEFQDKLIEANKMYVKRESDEIDQYVAHKGWNMITTGTGLRYMITRKGTGALAKPEQSAKVNFKISLLDGRVCYSSDSTGPKEFIVAGDNVESGLHEGIQYMHVGDKAILILPSHLAHGLIGDEDRIPPKASVIYELELLSLKERVKNQ
jgi:FKBP-type peptidyl-prolyl cis-trans isomerase FkpA